MKADDAFAGSGLADEPLNFSAREDSPYERHCLTDAVRRAIDQTRRWLLAQQLPEGCWCAELEGDTILESETILLWAFLGCSDSEDARRAAEYIRRRQLPGGGWAMYPGGAIEISGSVKAYFALKLTGHDPSAEYMQQARAAILAHGGADAVNSYTRFFLALLGQIPYDQCPEVPPEAVLLPRWFPISLHQVSSWSRTIIVPLSIVSAYRPVRQLPAELSIRELFLREPRDWPPLRCPGLPGGTGLFSWDRFFRGVDRALKFCRRHRLLLLRRRAIQAATKWMLERFEGSDGLGAIYPPIVWSIIALRCLGFHDDHSAVVYNHQQLRDLMIADEQEGTLRLQPCKSPVWDTGIAVRALAAAGVSPQSREMRRAARWLVERQIRLPGDWSDTVRTDPGGWCFEYHNDFYPDNDDTAMVLMALQTQFEQASDADRLPSDGRGTCRSESDEDSSVLLPQLTEAIARGARWMLAMQNDDGGWGAFDRNNNRQFLCYVPFADHNAMIDPSTPDLTARVLESLGKLGYTRIHPAVGRGIEYLRRTQEADGSWFGRWGVNYIYGTWQALVGLRAVGVAASDPTVVAGAQWLLAHQQPCGGWGESPNSYEHPHLRGQGVPTPSQTAWALLGLMAAGREDHPAVARGVRYLATTQLPDGSWAENEFTGTGFPRVFYLRYHYYRIYFPLLALSQWAATIPRSERA